MIEAGGNSEVIRFQKDLARALSEHGDAVTLPFNHLGYGADLRENAEGGYDAFVKHRVVGELKIGSYSAALREGAVEYRPEED